MNKKVIFLLYILVFPALLIAQKPPLASNIKMSIKNDKVEIKYDFQNYDPNKTHQINLLFRDVNSLYLQPKSLFGDIGKDIPAGKNKTILWDISGDLDIINSSLKPFVIVDGSFKEVTMGGPGYSLISAILPGTGNYFVKDKNEMFIKPYMKTIMYVTFLGLGMKAFSEYEHEHYYKQVGWGPITNGENVPLMGKFYREDHWLFIGDYELFFFTAGTIWFLDVFYTAVAGTHNRRIRNKLQNNRQINMGYTTNGFGVSFAQKF